MKIAYHAYWNIGHEDGVTKKMARQMHFWRAQGHEVRFYAFTPDIQPAACLAKLDVRPYRLRGQFDFFRVPFRIVQDLLADSPDLVYVRFNKYYPPLEKISSSCPLVFEINTNDVGEYRLNSRFPIYLYHRLTRRLALNNCNGMVFLSEGIAQNYHRYRKPYAVIGDSIVLEDYVPCPPAQNSQPHLVFMASNPTAWSGLDKLHLLACRFPDWTIEIIGLRQKDMPGRYLPNLICHGYLERRDYETILAGADIAVSALSLHRIGVRENAPLKVREYMAYGLPCILAYQDTDFPHGAPFVLQLPSTANNVIDHFGEIEQFVRSWQGKRIPRGAIEHLDVSYKENLRIKFFQEILGTA
jgi:glycosyltransferase involved in cell wall biosynthesis